MTNRPSQTTFGNAVTAIIRRAITDRGTYAKTVGEAAGIDQSMMSRITTYKRDFDVDQLARVCDVLNLDMCEVFREADAISEGRPRPPKILGRFGA